ncbi:Putative zinc-finger [Paenibacillus algorifonticola]|uniref:Anti-sigma-W factor RsiW n=1 Tax=Paenibacillus algorifonticola TaxID=684063 RepID=A0A1I2A1C8_9BACL|nr:zf-HC2 domain-containing protein [Paenibacillus algorifonticola]SFE36510.1 Putative zinc-finger [Paenibacillus algorifonticola]
MNCQEVMEYMQRELDGDLDEYEKATMTNHFKQCPDCAAMFERLKTLSAELENLPHVTPSYSLVDAIMPQLEQLSFEAAGSVVEPQEAAMPKRRKSPARGASSRLRQLTGVIAACLVAGTFIISYNAGWFNGSHSNNDMSQAEASATAADSPMANYDTSELKQFVATDPQASSEVKSESLDTGMSLKTNVTEQGGIVSEQDGGGVAGGSSSELGASDVGSASGLTAPDSNKENPDTGTDTSISQSPTEDNSRTLESLSGEPEKAPLAPVAVVSADGVYSAEVVGYVLKIYEASDHKLLLETSRKNGQIANLSWSEDNKILNYEIHLESGGIEKYAVDLNTLKDEKATH